MHSFHQVEVGPNPHLPFHRHRQPNHDRHYSSIRTYHNDIPSVVASFSNPPTYRLSSNEIPGNASRNGCEPIRYRNNYNWKNWICSLVSIAFCYLVVGILKLGKCAKLFLNSSYNRWYPGFNSSVRNMSMVNSFKELKDHLYGVGGPNFIQFEFGLAYCALGIILLIATLKKNRNCLHNWVLTNITLEIFLTIKLSVFHPFTLSLIAWEFIKLVFETCMVLGFQDELKRYHI